MSTRESNDRIKEGRRALRRGDFAAAADLFRDIVADNPDDATAYEGLGTACFSLGELEDAIDAFRRVTQLKPAEARGFINLGAIYNRRGDHQQALQTLRKALQKDRSSADAYYNMGVAHKGMNQLRMAVSAYREAIRLAPEMAEAHLNLANVYSAMDNPTQAITHYQKALEIRPDFERAARGLQQARQTQEERRSSARSLDRFAPAAAELSETEQTDDVSTVPISSESLELIYHTALRARDVAQQLSVQLTTEFERTLLELNKAITQNEDSPAALEERLTRFRTVVGEILPQFQELEIRVQQLHSHASSPKEG